MGPDLIQQLNTLIARYPDECIERTKLLKAREILINARTDPDPSQQQSFPLTERRLRYLRTIPIDLYPFTEEDRVNYRAVIDAYESGNLRVEDRQNVTDVAVFWNGRLVQSWGVLNANGSYEDDCVRWANELGGKCWIEDAEAEVIIFR